MPEVSICDNDYSYDTSKKLGEGHFGAVYRGRIKSTGQQVAVKVQKLFSDAADKRGRREVQALEDFSNETRTTSLKDNIVALYDTDEVGRELYLVMELCDGNLAKYIQMKGGQLSNEAVKRFLLQMSYGLKYIHDKGYIHRDLKPNILLKLQSGGSLQTAQLEDIVAKIGDLGLITKSPDANIVPSSIGYVDFMAPERRGGSHNYDSRSDIWCLGLIVYECLGGKEHRSTRGRQDKFNIPRQASPELKDLLGNMLAVNPEYRFSVNQVLQHEFFN